jgi:hypothetical protein
MKSPENYEFYPPEEVGRTREIVLGKHSGASAVVMKLKEMGIIVSKLQAADILNKIKDTQDFIGLNYYFHNLIDYGFSRQFSYEKKSDLDWGLHPEGIYYLLKDLFLQFYFLFVINMLLHLLLILNLLLLEIFYQKIVCIFLS